ncbi:inactive ferrous ion transporter periplasmic protein EfeO [Actinomyces viscosus]|uniref:Inactive ferrous ion transporter periplasmic protein EfeO n=1 Tax=Actinomyces viscosus TaxID=1656 RepID=A0A3S4WKP6_ACTVI|nr:hypothetical protein [Actinomyces viscosus]VEI17470.1 inactive ferrous ion transporter periplasmic protein EfeO [Actinomyces viscosus]
MPTIKRRNVLALLPLTAMGLGLAACADNPRNAKGGASGPGTTTKLTTSLKEGTYYAACKPNMVGELKGVTQLTITKGASIDISAAESFGLKEAGDLDAARQKVADQLNTDTKSLYDLVYGNITGTGGKKFELELEDVANGASSLLEEVATTKIVGEEETFSRTDL